MESGVPIYTNDETVEYFEVTSGELMTGLPEKRTINLENKFEITPFYVPHDDVPNYAFIIELSNGSRLLYATDFYCCHTDSKDEVKSSFDRVQSQ